MNWVGIRLEALLVLAVGSLSPVPVASAKDYGTLGSTWAIAEPDLLAVWFFILSRSG